jgi:HEPN domain-containing protein
MIDQTHSFAVPWLNYFRSWMTLWDVKHYLASRLIDVAKDVCQINGAIDSNKGDGAKRADIAAALMDIQEHCEFLGLQSTLAKVKRCYEQAKIGTLDKSEWMNHLDELESRFHDDIKGLHLLYIEPKKFALYIEQQPFGEEVHSRFFLANHDIREATRCLALNRYDACVFHSMRVLEHGLRALSERITNKRVVNPNWADMIKDIENAIKTRDSENPRKPRWKREREFFIQAALHFRYLKDALRNNSAHVTAGPVEMYENDSAEAVFEHVRDFMQHLTTKLKQRR